MLEPMLEDRETDDGSVDLEMEALAELDERPLTPQTPTSGGSSSDSDLDIPSAQPEKPVSPRAPTPVVPPSAQPAIPQPVTIQQFAEQTTGRVQQLEVEKTQLTQAHADLQARQDVLQASLEALQRRMGPVVLQANPDVRSRQLTAHPGQQRVISPAHRSQRVQHPLPPPVPRALSQPSPQITHELTRPSPYLPVYQVPVQPPVQEQPTPMLPILPLVRQTHQPDVTLWTQPLMTAPPTTLTDLRTDRQLMDQAARTVAANTTPELPESGKPPKSGLKCDNAEHVRLVIPWPHEHVLRHNSKPPTYESLSLSEFAAGNMRIIAANAVGVPLVVHMANYLAELFDDATDTDWPAARFAHRVVLQAMENGRLDYSSTLELRQMRSMALTRATRRPTPAPAATAPAPRQRQWASASAPSQPKRACTAFQKGDCPQQKSHQSSTGYLFHACAFCLTAVGRTYNHPESECRCKNGSSRE